MPRISTAGVATTDMPPKESSGGPDFGNGKVLCVQSVLHREHRYVLAMQYFLFVPAAVTLHKAGLWMRLKWASKG